MPAYRPLIFLAAVPLVACKDAGSGDTAPLADTGFTGGGYAFQSAFADGSSVSYGGQVFRHLLIDDMKTHLSGVTDRLNSGALYPVNGDVLDELNFYFEFDSDAYGALEHGWSADPAALQVTYDDVSSGKDLVGKIAGNDAIGQHVDWSTGLRGWGDPGSTTPEGLVRAWCEQIDAQAVAWSAGDVPLTPDGAPAPAVYVTVDGLDLQQLLEKFLRGAIAFSQGADDYLDDDTEGKGLLSDHTAPEDGEAYTALEHAWDEGFGYFGAARTFPDWTDDALADAPAMDVDGDGAIDLLTEVNWGHATNAAKRDLGAVAPIDLTAEAWAGFYEGRALLAETAGAGLTDDQLAALQGHRDRALEAWEAAIAASVIHYINDTLRDMAALDSEDYSFADHAKHWSELKGFALSLQFNRRSPLAGDDFQTLHDYIGDAPVLSDADAEARSAYAADLLAARALIGDAYGFDDSNLGDENGENGW